jgi:hypothetical protein
MTEKAMAPNNIQAYGRTGLGFKVFVGPVASDTGKKSGQFSQNSPPRSYRMPLVP